jgi:hypothetical protein
VSPYLYHSWIWLPSGRNGRWRRLAVSRTPGAARAALDINAAGVPEHRRAVTCDSAPDHVPPVRRGRPRHEGQHAGT